jgi:saccharopine dehydrogenase (NADP+, L-glutamate forming)
MVQLKNILILGAGLSSTTLIKFLIKNSEKYNWKITVADKIKELADKKVKNHKNTKAISIDINNTNYLAEIIKNNDVIVSMLPAFMHPEIASICLKYHKHLATASYLSEEISRMDSEVKNKKLLFLNELGVDPGLDHISAMTIIDRIKDSGDTILSFRSDTGGLISPEYDNNPWNYKFTWNPRNVILAGYGTAKYLEEGQIKYIPYNQLFSRIVKTRIKELGNFEAYANRDSLKYIDKYNLKGVKSIIRGTFRREGFCEAWNIFVQLGMTDDSYDIINNEEITLREFTNKFLAYHKTESVEKKFKHFIKRYTLNNIYNKFEWLELFSDKIIPLKNATPAVVLQWILQNKWSLEIDDKDMIVMQHQITYQHKETIKKLTSWIYVNGTDSENTAMAMTVGMPLAIAVKLLMTGKIKMYGVHIPTIPELYKPIMNELSKEGIIFNEHITDIN